MRPDDDRHGYEVEDYGDDDAREGGYGHAPPTVAGPIYQRGPSSSWPTVFGVIGIIISAWGLFVSGCGVLMLAGVGGALGFGGTGQFSQQMQAAGVTGMNLVVGGLQYAIGLSLAVYLLVASIGLIKRTRSGARHMVLWSWIRIAAFAFTTVLAFVTTNYSQMSQQLGGQGQGLMIGMLIGGVLFSAVFSLWFPVLNLIWFRRAAIRGEVSQWV